MKLFGKTITPKELKRRVGLIDQVAGVRLVTLDDGHARGSRAALVQTGSGLDFTILIDRCMDLGGVTFNGAALGWRSSVGDVAPQYFEPEHIRWLRSFQGGLLATCGLSNVGAPQAGSEVSGLGLHEERVLADVAFLVFLGDLFKRFLGFSKLLVFVDVSCGDVLVCSGERLE